MARPIVKKDIIVRSALEVFAEKGVEATTIQDIAKRANAAGGTLYRYFGSKDELAQSIFFDNLAEFMKELEQVFAEKLETKKRLCQMIAKFYEFFERDEILFSYLLLSEHNFAKKMSSNQQTPIDLIVRFIEEGIKCGDLPKQDSTFAAAFIYGAVVRVAFFKIYGRISQDIRTYQKRVVAGCWSFLTSAS